MMMEAAVRGEKYLAARNLSIHHATHVDARLAHEKATEFDDDASVW